MNCETCAERRKQAENPVPYISHEADMARMERTNRRLVWLLVLLVLVCGVLGFLYVDSITAYETLEATVEVDTGDGAAFVAGIGDVYYGESQSNDQTQNP